MKDCWTFVAASVAALAISALPASAEHYGFGVIKKTVTLERRLLPDTKLGNASVAVVFPRGTGGLDGNVFSSDLETLIAQNGGGIRLVASSPDYQVQCFTTAYQPPRITVKTSTTPFMKGSAGTTTQREAHGNVALDARLIRVSDGAALAAFTETVTVNANNFGGNNSFTVRIPGMRNRTPVATADPLPDSATDATLTSGMLKTLALRVASHMVPMNEQIPVLLAQGGPLDEASRLATNNRWSDYLEKLSTVTAPTDPADNAYLLYDQGVANEALGYAAGDPKTTLKYLQESSIAYSKATEAKPAEKYFIEPQKRIETAITRYTKLAQAENSPAATTAMPTSGGGNGATGGGGNGENTNRRSPETLTNADVIKLEHAHLDKGLILNKIRTAPAVNFDLSVDGLVSLSQSGVPSDVISAMTTRSSQHR